MMMDPSVWKMYCDAYARFGEAPVTFRDIFGGLGASELMCRKVIWELRHLGLLKVVERKAMGRGEGWLVRLKLVPPTVGIQRLALLHFGVARAEVLRLFKGVQEKVHEWYLVGTPALCYHFTYYAPRVEIASQEDRALERVLRIFPFIPSATSARIPKEFEEIEFGGTRFKIASPADAILECYRGWPRGAGELRWDAHWANVDFMAVVVINAWRRSFDFQRLDELPKKPRNHIFDLLAEQEKWSSKTKLRLSKVQEEAKACRKTPKEVRIAELIDLISSSVGWFPEA